MAKSSIDIAESLARLSAATIFELRGEWRRLHRAPPPMRLSQFNTTTSMGRLTLNVLLSFAQFEREVTGERARLSRVILLWRDDRGCGHVFGLLMRVMTPIGPDVVR